MDEDYVANGGEETDYILAHELGHAVRIASGKEPAKAAEIWEHIQSEGMDSQQTNAYIDLEERGVRELLYQEEEVTWKIAGDLLGDIGDPAERLAVTTEKSLQTYREGWRLD